MESEKEKLMRAYRQDVKDGAATVLLLVTRGELTVDEIRDELELFAADTAESAIEEIFGGVPRDALLN